MAIGRYRFPNISYFTFLLVLKTSYLLFDKLLVEVHFFKGKNVGGRGWKQRSEAAKRMGRAGAELDVFKDSVPDQRIICSSSMQLSTSIPYEKHSF